MMGHVRHQCASMLFIISYVNEVIETLSASGNSKGFYTTRTGRTQFVEHTAPTNSTGNVHDVMPHEFLLHAWVYGSYKYNKSSVWF
jgi:hypothetical protein